MSVLCLWSKTIWCVKWKQNKSFFINLKRSNAWVKPVGESKRRMRFARSGRFTHLLTWDCSHQTSCCPLTSHISPAPHHEWTEQPGARLQSSDTVPFRIALHHYLTLLTLYDIKRKKETKTHVHLQFSWHPNICLWLIGVTTPLISMRVYVFLPAFPQIVPNQPMWGTLSSLQA